MIHSYRAIFFDAGGTLLHPYPSVGEIYSEVASRYNFHVSSQEIQTRFMKEWKQRDGMSQLTHHVTEKIEKEWWRAIVRDVFCVEKEFPKFDDFFEELYELFGHPDVWRLYPGTHEVLLELKRRGKKLAIVSNWDSRLFKLCDSLDLTKHFDFILASAVFGASKPGPKIFEEALKKIKVEAREALHIGDSFEDDVRGAARVGIKTVLIDRHAHFSPTKDMPVLPDYVIRDLAELTA